MNRQLSMFDGTHALAKPTAPYAKGSETSKAAAESISVHLPRLEALVLRMFDDAWPCGLTNKEVESESRNYTGDGKPLKMATVTGRTHYLKGGRGRDKPAGAELIRETGSSRDGSAVMVITREGREALLDHEREQVAKRTGGKRG